MNMSNRLTLCFLSIFLLLAFVAVPVWSHQMTTNVDPHVNADPDTDNTPGTDHALVESVTVSSNYLTAAAPITATITFADGVAAVVDDDDTTTGTGNNGDRHATLSNTAVDLANVNISIEFGTKQTDGTYTYAAADNSNGPQIITVVKTIPEGSGDTGSGAVYTVYIQFPNVAAADRIDGQYRIGVTNAAGVFNADDDRATFFMDTHAPIVSNVSVQAIGQDYANAEGEWDDPFEIRFSLEDPSFDKDEDGIKVDDSDFEASGLKLDTIMFEVKDADDEVTTSELTFGDVLYTGSEYVVKATPVKSATQNKAAAEVTVIVKVMDKAGNEGSSALRPVKLAERSRTGPGQGETEKPTLTDIEAPDAAEDDGTLVFTITFSEAIAVTGANAFTREDLEVSNATSYTLTTTDKTVFKVTVTPDNKDFPVKVTIKAKVMVQDTNDNVSAELKGDATYTPEGVLGVEIKQPTKPSLDGKLVFDFTFAEVPEDEGPGAFTVSDITTSNAESLTAADLSQSLNNPKVFRLRVTPTDSAMPVTVQLNGDSVRHHGPGADGTLGTDDAPSDDDVFLVAGEIQATYTPPTPDETAPVVSITAPTSHANNVLVFTIDFNEELSAALMVDNLAITGAADTPAPALASVTTGLPTTVAQRYTLTVTGTPGTAVTVNLKMNVVMDDAENSVAPLATAASYTIPMPGRDTTAPTLEITHSPPDRKALPTSGVVTFTFTFTEASGALGSNDAAFTSGDVTIENGSRADFRPVSALVYELDVTPEVATQPVKVTVAASAVSDAAGNNLAIGVSETYIAFDDVAPTVTIKAVPGTGDNANKIVYTFTFSEPLMETGDGAFTEADILRGTGVLLAKNPTMDANNNKVYTVLVTPAATGSTILTLRTGSVTDMAGNALSGDQSHTYKAPDAIADPTLDPTTATIPSIFAFRIPANSYVVLVRNALATPRQDGLNFRDVPDSRVVVWDNMPDLWERLFDRGYEGGGALVLRSSHGDAAADRPKVGTVGISEVMWAIDIGRYGEYRSGDRGDNRNKTWLDSQWVEVHNLNTKAVNVLIYAQTGRDLVGTGNVVGNTKAGDTIHGNPGGMVVDVMTNFFNGADRGSGGWDVPGANGNSKAGVDFISMARQPKRGSFNLTRRHENKLDGLYVKTGGQDQSLDGRASGSWAAGNVIYEREDTDIPAGTTAALPLTYEYYGTPGHPNTRAPASHITRDTRTGVASNSVIINEVANRNAVNKAYEWIELRNVTDAEINLRNYLISIVQALDSDKVLYQFPANDNAKIPANGVFLLVASDPRGNPSHPLAVGYNVDMNDEDQAPGTRKNQVRYKVADVGGVPGFGNGRNTGESVTELPNDGKFVLILRRPDNNEGHRSGADGGKGVAERGKDDLDKIVDIAGWHDNLKKTGYSNAVSSTDLWPLRNFRAPNFNLNSFGPETVHFRQRGAHGLGGVNDGASGVGAHENKNEGGKAAFRNEGYSGIGYKRQASKTNYHGGSPGYHGNVKGKANDLADGKVVISEIMLSQGNGRTKLPQWIELYNPSKTQAVNLTDNAGWRLVIENPNRAPIRTIHFKSGKHNVKTILPNQTVLIISSSARDYGGDRLPRGTVFPPTRVLNAYTVLKGETFQMESRTAPLLDPKAFNIRLLDGTTTNNKPDGRYAGVVSDEVGNLDGNPRTNDSAAWEFPAGMTEDGDRTSLIRIFDAGVARSGTGLVEPMGGVKAKNNPKYSWVHASDTEDFEQLFVRHTWYGAESDYGTPLDRTGQILPVSLSFFRPTLQDGKVVIRWTTESELDNAGFNILRSETRNGEFKQVNTELIAGNGTTGERHTYKWVDPTAKPGVVYYYQIEDVSFAGERQTLALTKLKGLISAKDKLTTTWGELKEVQ